MAGARGGRAGVAAGEVASRSNNDDASRPLRIEHRLADGEHMHLADPVEAETVTNALVSFAAGDDAWRRLPWEPLLL